MNNFYNPYPNFNPNIERLKRQREDIDNLLNSMQQQPAQPVNNIINAQPTQQIANDKMVEMRVLNEGEQVDNLYVNNKTLFVNDNQMVLKGVDGKLEKWNIEKVYPVDPKDQEIKELKQQIEELKGMIQNELAKSSEPTKKQLKANGNATINNDTTTEPDTTDVQRKK